MAEYNKLRDVRIGLEIFERHGGRFCDARHDEFLAGPEKDADLTESDRATLEQHGWSYDEDVESWTIFT